MLESQIERKLVQGVKMLGGVAYKFVSPGNTGVPDRLIVLPGGHVCFVELKTDEGQLSNIQKAQIDRLKNLHADVRVVRGMRGVEDFLNWCEVYLNSEI